MGLRMTVQQQQRPALTGRGKADAQRWPDDVNDCQIRPPTFARAQGLNVVLPPVPGLIRRKARKTASSLGLRYFDHVRADDQRTARQSPGQCPDSGEHLLRPMGERGLQMPSSAQFLNVQLNPYAAAHLSGP